MTRLAIITTLALALSGTAFAHEPDRPARAVITPYGDFCPLCSKYGIGRNLVRVHEAVGAAEAYFGNKGLEIGNISHRGRFIVMDVFSDGKLVDRVVLDRRTGRIRSIY